ncbi:AAA family ATPase [Celerinatantimonas diazotrophica]|uniref:AAA family ATPase n=1 Tax=Celerinatantimonas diazotrophica TaxID=412034 RepID=UPI0021E194F1|nr:AAA family ATPase [Celerinatantimonas diazotrophica]
MFNADLHKTKPIIDLLEHEYQDNLSRIESKISKPSFSVELINCDDKLIPLKQIATEINESVQAAIAKSIKYKENKNDIGNRMWDSIRHNTDSIFSLENSMISQKHNEIKSLKKKLERVTRIGNKVKERVKHLRSKTSNIDDTIERINIQLTNLGLTNFEIKASSNPDLENYFVLSRGETTNTDNVFKSLSEGEKTLITFLYFIEQCNGSMSKESGLSDKDKLIVIDDPISSLSQNYIYDIASLIHTKIINGDRFKKVIVLTHSLFFYQELLKLAPQSKDKFNKKYSLYRLNKKKYSSIQEMDRGDLKNDYQSLWQILKDVIAGNVNPVVLPNVMRNILEYYFGFVHKKDKLSSILNRLAENEPEQGYKAFYRYINRSSHSDPSNIGLMIEVDPHPYLERFESIFDESQDKEHYICMMES